MDSAEQSNTETAKSKGSSLEPLFSDGELNEQALKEKARDVRRTMRKANHFSRQERPLQRARTHARKSVRQLQLLASFDRGLKTHDWSPLVDNPKAVAESIDPFLSFYRSHGKLPDIDLDEALAYVLYFAGVEGLIDLGTDLEMSRDTPRGYYP